MVRIGGTLFAYWFICKRKAWYFSHGISMEHESDSVKLGKLIDNTTYSRDRKQVAVDDIAVDFIRGQTVHEVKRSKSMETASIWQLKYYMYVLEKHGLGELDGRLDFPTLRKGLNVKLEDGDREIIESTIKQIQEMAAHPVPPTTVRLPICKSCAWYELCWI